MRPKTAISIMVAGIFAASSTPAGGSKATLKSLGERLICQCGCNMTVNSCNHYVCWSRTEMQARIEKEIAEGKDETTILQDFVLRDGVMVLSTPPARGFNLTVWILPGLGLITGFVLLIVIIKRWQKPTGGSRDAPAATIDPKLLVAVKEEMKTSGHEVRD